MAAPAAFIDPLNPFKSISPPTWEPGTPLDPATGMPFAPMMGQAPMNGQMMHRMKGGKVSRTKTMAMEHRDTGGGVQPSRRTRQFAPGTAAVPYSRPGIGVGGRAGMESGSMVTGGTGAAPALPGRIGYRGRLTSGAPAENGLDWLKHGLDQNALNLGAKKEIDPVTGLSMNPTEAEIHAQLQMLAAKGEQPGAEGQGVGGSHQAEAVANYYKAKQGGDPTAIANATQAVQNLKRTINTVSQPAPSSLGQTMPPPAGTPPAAPASANQPAPGGLIPPTGQVGGEETGYEGSQPPASAETGYEGRKKGGDTKAVHPYDVNEQGTEAFVPKGGKPELIPGGEHVTTFPRAGRVIPHGRTMSMMSKGLIQPTEANPDFPATPVSSGSTPPMDQPTEYDPNPPANPVHREVGGPVHREPPHLFSYRSPIGRLAGRTGDFINRGIAAVKYPFVEPPAPVAPTRPISMADLLTPENYGSTVPLSDEDPNYVAPMAPMEQHVEPEWGDQPPAPVAAPNEGNWLHNLLGQIRGPAQMAQQHAAQNVVADNLATDRLVGNASKNMVGNVGVQQIGTLAGQDRSFLTPYGTIGLGHRAKGGKVSRTRMMAGK